MEFIGIAKIKGSLYGDAWEFRIVEGVRGVVSCYPCSPSYEEAWAGNIYHEEPRAMSQDELGAFRYHYGIPERSPKHKDYPTFPDVPRLLRMFHQTKVLPWWHRLHLSATKGPKGDKK